MFYAMEAYLQQEDEEKKEKYIQYKAKFQDFKQKGGTIEIRYSYLASKESEEKILYLAPFIEEDTKKEEKPKKKKGKKTKKEKEASIHTIGELAGEFVPCEENYCPACDLFGYAASRASAYAEETSVSSRKYCMISVTISEADDA